MTETSHRLLARSLEIKSIAGQRRSPRFVALNASNQKEISSTKDQISIPPSKQRKASSKKAHSDIDVEDAKAKPTKKRKRYVPSKETNAPALCTADDADNDTKSIIQPKKHRGSNATTLPRTVEASVRRREPVVRYVLGIDEAGRGPLAGPVVVAAVRMTADPAILLVEGVHDSKQINSEEQREHLYKQLILSLSTSTLRASTKEPPSSSSTIEWAIAVVDAAKIDEINILQATMYGMELVASAIMEQSVDCPIVEHETEDTDNTQYPGCFVIVGRSGKPPANQLPADNRADTSTTRASTAKPIESPTIPSTSELYYALIDGNRLPKNMPCPAEALIKGDTREYCIAAASILAKVTRDRMMHRYHAQYPQYNFAQHKGYPTAAHMQAIRTHGPLPIHRRSFAPLKKKSTATRKK